jgi:hypothetical protein
MDAIPIGKEVEIVQKKSCCPKYWPCPQCGKNGRRRQKTIRFIRHIAYGRASWIELRLGIYQARCGCCQSFRSTPEFVPKAGKYTFAVRDAIVRSLVRDGLSAQKTQQRMKEDFCLEVSIGFIHGCLGWAYDQVDQQEYLRWAKQNFSGVCCIDEVHDAGKAIFFVTDPLNDLTIYFHIADRADAAALEIVLRHLAEAGIEPQVAVTDGSPLYKQALAEQWQNIEHQLCIFHVLKEANKTLLDAVRGTKNRLRRAGQAGRKRRRGRPSKKALQRRQHRQAQPERNRKEQAKFIWEHQHLIVKREDRLTEQDHKDLERLYQIAPELQTYRQFSLQLHGLFRKNQSKHQAWCRRAAMIRNKTYQKDCFLRRILKRLAREKFAKMITFLGWENVDRTNNHVERCNRSFRMSQKTRYKRRRKHTIERAMWVELDRRRKLHYLNQPPIIKLAFEHPHSPNLGKQKAA